MLEDPWPWSLFEMASLTTELAALRAWRAAWAMVFPAKHAADTTARNATQPTRCHALECSCRSMLVLLNAQVSMRAFRGTRRCMPLAATPTHPLTQAPGNPAHPPTQPPLSPHDTACPRATAPRSEEHTSELQSQR